MTATLAALLISCVLSLVLTPVAGFAGRKWRLLDRPGGRKAHLTILPRSGGLGIMVSVQATLFFLYAVNRFQIPESSLVKFWALTAGAVLCFLVGMWDDRSGLSAKVKLVFQIAAASIAYWGGLRIYGVGIASDFLRIHLESYWLSYLVTVFWFVLITNAINLIDGLDGLAGGIIFLVSLMMVLVLLQSKPQPVAVIFAAVAGATLGFLRYNFNPASIFLGDSGGYFLGFYLAGLSLLGSVKSHVGAALTVLILALGIPIFDTLLAPLRRIAKGEKAFAPDRSHIHHKLLETGLTVKSAVVFIYGVTLALCGVSLALVYNYQKKTAFFLIIIGISLIFLFHFAGYYVFPKVGSRTWRRPDFLRRLFFSKTRRAMGKDKRQEMLGELNTALSAWDSSCVTISVPVLLAEKWKIDVENVFVGAEHSVNGGIMNLRWVGQNPSAPGFTLKFDRESESWSADMHIPGGYEPSWIDLQKLRYLTSLCSVLMEQDASDETFGEGI